MIASQISREIATKNDLNELRADLYRYIFGVAIGQVALLAALLTLLS